MDIKIVSDANLATGLTVVIDVFRAFSVEAYLINNGVKRIVPVGDMQIAYDYKAKDNKIILIGERKGIMLEGFDYGNSPSQIENVDFSGKKVIHTTSCGTQGIVKSVNAKQIITGSLVNAKAIVRYILQSKEDEISLLTLCKPEKKPFEEDVLCANYIKSLLENNVMSNLEEEIEKLKDTTGAKFFDKSRQKDFPERDFYLCTQVNKFDFVLKVCKDEEDERYIERIDVPE